MKRTYYGNGVVWNPDRQRELCKFVNGQFETDRVEVIEMLDRLGYPCDPVIEVESIEVVEAVEVVEVKPVVEIVPLEMTPTKEEKKSLKKMTAPELRKVAKTMGLKGYSSLGKPALIKLIEG